MFSIYFSRAAFRIPALALKRGLILVVWGCALSVLRANAQDTSPETGVISVSAGKDQIELTVRSGGMELQIVDLAIPASLRDVENAHVVGEVAPAAQSHVVVPRFEHERDRLYDGFVARGKEGKAVGALRRVEEMRGIAKNTEPIPKAASIKGLQVQMVDDAIALGVKHAALNVDLAALIDPVGQADSFSWTMDGRTFHFRRGPMTGHDRQIKELSDAGIQVTLILLNYKKADPALSAIVKPATAGGGSSSPIWGFNVSDPEGCAWYRATLEFLADRYAGGSSDQGRVVGYIIGNEVDSHDSWYDVGPVSLDELVENYERALRFADLAVHKAAQYARVYISLDRQWTEAISRDPKKAVPARVLLDALAKRARAEGDFDWNVAFHPYPKDLRDPRTWRDHLPSDPNAVFISPQNIEVLPAYLKKPELLYRGQPRHIILSEQGFNTRDGEDGEKQQAAGFCYTWVKLSHVSGIDAFILHRHVDHAKEGGLRLGLWTFRPGTMSTPDRKKPIYEVFRACDTGGWREAFAPYLSEIGTASWDEVR